MDKWMRNISERVYKNGTAIQTLKMWPILEINSTVFSFRTASQKNIIFVYCVETNHAVMDYSAKIKYRITDDCSYNEMIESDLSSLQSFLLSIMTSIVTAGI